MQSYRRTCLTLARKALHSKHHLRKPTACLPAYQRGRTLAARRTHGSGTVWTWPLLRVCKATSREMLRTPEECRVIVPLAWRMVWAQQLIARFVQIRVVKKWLLDGTRHQYQRDQVNPQR